MQELDRIFDSDDVAGTLAVDAVNHGRECARFARTGRSGHQDQSPLFLADFLHDRRKIEPFQRRNNKCNRAEDHRHRTALAVDADPEAPQPRDGIRQVDFKIFLKHAPLTIIHHRLGGIGNKVRRQTRGVGNRVQTAINPYDRRQPGLDVNIGTLGLKRDREYFVQIHSLPPQIMQPYLPCLPCRGPGPA